MTLPDERSRSIRQTREFLYSLLDPRATPRTPRLVRDRARRCLRHYPGTVDMLYSARACPNIWDEEVR